VTLSAVETDNSVEITIADTGRGIPHEDRERVFERFYRGTDADASEVSGSGLGLPIAREVARAHDGDVTLTSAAGSGTTIVMRLPKA